MENNTEGIPTKDDDDAVRVIAVRHANPKCALVWTGLAVGVFPGGRTGEVPRCCDALADWKSYGGGSEPGRGGPV